jgi:selenocysteine-specific translation elongation factor
MSINQQQSGSILIFEILDAFRPPERSLNRPVRLVVSDVFRSTGSGCCLAGRIESGMVQTGDKLLLMPVNEVVHVKSMYIEQVFSLPFLAQIIVVCYFQASVSMMQTSNVLSPEIK